MTTPPGEPQQFGPNPPPQGSGGRKALPWLVGSAVVVVAAVVVTLVLTRAGDDRAAKPDSYDLSSPEKAAESFAAAARTGDGKAVLRLTCMAHADCLMRQGERVTPERLEDAQDMIVNGVDELAEQLAGVEFGESSEGSMPDTIEVEYRTPRMSDDQRLFLIFVEFDGDWLYAGSAGGGR